MSRRSRIPRLQELGEREHFLEIAGGSERTRSGVECIEVLVVLVVLARRAAGDERGRPDNWRTFDYLSP